MDLLSKPSSLIFPAGEDRDPRQERFREDRRALGDPAVDKDYSTRFYVRITCSDGLGIIRHHQLDSAEPDHQPCDLRLRGHLRGVQAVSGRLEWWIDS